MDVITQSELHQLMSYNPETGIFTWKIAKRGRSIGDEIGSHSEYGYVRIGIDGRRYMAHQLAWLYMTGAWPSQEIDHKDANRANNRWNNLRLATRRQQVHNATWPNSLGIRGVKKYGDRFQARISFLDKRLGKTIQKSLGYYLTAKEAGEVYDLAAQLIHGEFYRG